ncbi:hypothetical protein JTE90_004863 [Oedothorax gibbosus]|uniref:Uncharacterized protein n=1 Tax=Oedothorax gibbosus TaxID=931172 RepID=A0AAV6URN4_9ARAC|nr:hypothetical protein JTE90_004863 [Oedothorax gibbosus]
MLFISDKTQISVQRNWKIRFKVRKHHHIGELISSPLAPHPLSYNPVSPKYLLVVSQSSQSCLAPASEADLQKSLRVYSRCHANGLDHVMSLLLSAWSPVTQHICLEWCESAVIKVLATRPTSDLIMTTISSFTGGSAKDDFQENNKVVGCTSKERRLNYTYLFSKPNSA